MRVLLSRRRPVVLLLDNDRDPCQVIAQRLGDHGFTVVVVTAAEALLACRVHHGPIDVLVADTDLPGLRADELARQACLIRPRIQTIFLGDPPAGTGWQAWPPTAGVCLPQPCTVASLASMLHTVVGRQN